MWGAIFAPANTPREIIARLSEEIVAVFQSVEFARTIEDQGALVFIDEFGNEVVSRNKILRRFELRDCGFT